MNPQSQKWAYAPASTKQCQITCECSCTRLSGKEAYSAYRHQVTHVSIECTRPPPLRYLKVIEDDASQVHASHCKRAPQHLEATDQSLSVYARQADRKTGRSRRYRYECESIENEQVRQHAKSNEAWRSVRGGDNDEHKRSIPIPTNTPARTASYPGFSKRGLNVTKTHAMSVASRRPR